jgi:hypothetical protein
VAADHRQARGPAVGLVELVDVREAPDPPRRLGELGVGDRLTRRRLGRLRARLAVHHRHRVHRRCRRQDLVREVERHARAVAVLVARDPLLDAAAEVGVPVQQALERRGRDRQQRQVVERVDGGRAGPAGEQRRLAEHVALA